MDLSILIPTVPVRKPLLNNLLSILHKQINNNNLENRVEILIYEDNFEKSVGEKRNILCERAKGKYVLILDDDDMVSEDFCVEICNVISKHDVDQICFTTHQLNPKTKKVDVVFKSSKNYKEILIVLSKYFKIGCVTFHESFDCAFVFYFRDSIFFKIKNKFTSILFLKFFTFFFKKPHVRLTYADKVLPIKKEIALKVKYSDLPRDEDLEWVENLRRQDLIKTEYIIDKVLEYYLFNFNKSLYFDN